MLKSEAHSQNIVSSVKKDIFIKSVFNSPDLVIICKNGVQLKMHRDLLCLFSPLLRDIFWSIQNTDTALMISDISHVTVKKVIEVLEMGWNESVILDKEVVLLLHILNMNLGESEIIVKKEMNFR